MSLDKDLEELRFDKRMTDWNINKKLITQDDINKHLNSLKDSADLAQPLLSEENTPEESK